MSMSRNDTETLLEAIPVAREGYFTMDSLKGWQKVKIKLSFLTSLIMFIQFTVYIWYQFQKVK